MVVWRSDVNKILSGYSCCEGTLTAVPSAPYLVLLSWQMELLSYLKIIRDATRDVPTPVRPDSRLAVTIEVGRLMFRCCRDMMRYALRYPHPLGDLPGYSLTLLFFGLAVLMSASQVEEDGTGAIEIESDIKEFKALLAAAHRSGDLYVRYMSSASKSQTWSVVVPSQQSTALQPDLDWLNQLFPMEDHPAANGQANWSASLVDEWLALLEPRMELLPWNNDLNQLGEYL